MSPYFDVITFLLQQIPLLVVTEQYCEDRIFLGLPDEEIKTFPYVVLNLEGSSKIVPSNCYLGESLLLNIGVVYTREDLLKAGAKALWLELTGFFNNQTYTQGTTTIECKFLNTGSLITRTLPEAQTKLYRLNFNVELRIA